MKQNLLILITLILCSAISANYCFAGSSAMERSFPMCEEKYGEKYRSTKARLDTLKQMLDIKIKNTGYKLVREKGNRSFSYCYFRSTLKYNSHKDIHSGRNTFAKSDEDDIRKFLNDYNLAADAYYQSCKEYSDCATTFYYIPKTPLSY